MELIDYISNDNITTSPKHTVQEILKTFNRASYTHIPVVVDGTLIGNLPKEDLLSIENKKQKIEELEYLYEFFFAEQQDILLEAFSNFSVNNTNVLPVINDQKKYIGYLDLQDTLDCFADTDFLKEEGSVLLLEKKTVSFSMSEICQIVETNNNMMLGCFVSEKSSAHTRITLKVKSVNVNELIQSFRRYDYVIINNLTEDSYLEGLKKRSEYFIKFLNI